MQMISLRRRRGGADATAIALAAAHAAVGLDGPPNSEARPLRVVA